MVTKVLIGIFRRVSQIVADFLPPSLIFAGSLTAGGIAIWISGRGLPYSDEAFYILQSRFPSDVMGSVGAPQWLSGYLWSISGSLQVFRITGIFLLIFSSISLASSVIVALSADVRFSICSKVGIIGLSVTGALSYGSIINFSPSYNLMSSSFGYIAGAIALLISAKSRFRQEFQLFALGCVLALSCVAKPTSWIVLSILCVWLIYPALNKKMLGFFHLLSGFIISIFALICMNSSIAKAWRLQIQGNSLYRDVVTTSAKMMIRRYSNDLLTVTQEVIFAYPTSSIVLFLFLKVRSFFTYSLVVGVMIFELFSNKGWMGGKTLFSVMAIPIIFVVLFSIGLTIRSWASTKAVSRPLYFLLLMPLVLGFGTSNPITTAALYALAPWAIFVAVVTHNKYSLSKFRLNQLLAPLMLALLLGQFSTSTRTDPYELPFPYNKQNNLIQTNLIGAVRVDPLTQSYIEKGLQLQNICGWDDETLFIGEYMNPGLPLVLNTKPFGTPWLNNFAQLHNILDAFFIDPKTPLVVAQFIGFGVHGAQNSPGPTDTAKRFSNRSFQLCGEISYPYADQTSLVYYSNGNR